MRALTMRQRQRIALWRRGVGGAAGGEGGESAVVGVSDTITANDLTITLSAPATYGYSQDGAAFIVAEPGLTILSRTDAATSAEGSPVNGTMKNPQRGTLHGYDGRLVTYSAGLNQSFPISVAAGDVVVCAKHEPVALADSRSGVVQSYHAFFFVASPWLTGQHAPAVTGWTGRGAPAAYTVDLDAALAAMPSYDLSGLPYPVVGDVIQKVDRLEIGMGHSTSTSDGGYEWLTTRNAGGAGGSNYGQYLARWRGAAALHIIGNVATVEQKRTLLSALIREGIQTYDPIAGVGNEWLADGGHRQFSFLPMALALRWGGRPELLATMASVAPGNTLTQPFIYTAGLIADLLPHSDTSKPYVSRLRPVTAVSGNLVSVQTDRTGAVGDPARICLRELHMVRPSDGAFAYATAQDKITIAANTTDTVVVTINAQPTPAFAPSDNIFFRSIDPVVEGDVDWKIGSEQRTINPSFQSEYRDLNFWTAQALGIRAMGCWHESFEAFELYTARANRSGDPASSRDFPDHHDTLDGGLELYQAFWNAYAPQIIGDKPVFLTRPSISGSVTEGSTLTAVVPVMAGQTPITLSYQWQLDGVDTGVPATTFIVPTGNLGKVVSIRATATNSLGSRSLLSQPTAGIAASYAPVAVEFDGTNDWLGVSTGFVGGPASKVGAIIGSLYVPSAWPSTGNILQMTNSGGNARVNMAYASGGRITVTLRDATGTQIATFTCPTGTFAVDTWYTVAYAWNTATSTWVGRFRPAGGAWAIIPQIGAGSVLTMTADALVEAISLRCAFGATNTSGSTRVPLSYYSDWWATTGQLPDLTDSSVLAKFLPGVDKGGDGSLPTGTAPFLFLSGALASWPSNKGTGGGLTMFGALTAAPSVPT